MKVCLISHQVGDVFSGPGLYTNLLIEALLRSNHEITVVSTKNQKSASPTPYRYIQVSPQIRVNNLGRWIPLSLAYNQAIRKLENETDFDLIHFTDFREALFCSSKAPILANINDTYTIENFSLEYYRENYFDGTKRWLFYKFSHWMEANQISKINYLIANSQYTLKKYMSAYPHIQDRLGVIYKSVDPNRYSETFEKRKKQTNQFPYILFVGGNMQRKGVPDLIRAASIIKTSIPTAQITIIGEDPTKGKLRQLAKSLFVDHLVHFVGHKSQEELLDFYSKADIFVMPSLMEAFGVAILEAMAAGVPVIASNVGGIPEIIQPGTNGSLVPPRRPDLLAQAIRDLWKSTDLRQQFIENGVKTVWKYSSDRMTKETQDLYIRFMSSHI